MSRRGWQPCTPSCNISQALSPWFLVCEMSPALLASQVQQLPLPSCSPTFPSKASLGVVLFTPPSSARRPLGSPGRDGRLLLFGQKRSGEGSGSGPALAGPGESQGGRWGDGLSQGRRGRRGRVSQGPWSPPLECMCRAGQFLGSIAIVTVAYQVTFMVNLWPVSSLAIVASLHRVLELSWELLLPPISMLLPWGGGAAVI